MDRPHIVFSRRPVFQIKSCRGGGPLVQAIASVLEYLFLVLSILTDEAPDTGDDSDEDLITSYLSGGNAAVGVPVGGQVVPGGAGVGADVAGHLYGDVIPTINVTPHSPNSNHILGKVIVDVFLIRLFFPHICVHEEARFFLAT